MAEVKSYKVLTLPSNPQPNSIYWVKSYINNDVSGFITDIYGVPFPLKDLQGGTITNVTNTDGNLVITGITNKIVNLNPSLLTLINNSLQVGGNISSLVNNVGFLTVNDLPLQKVSGENIPSYTPIAIINNLAYKLDNLNSSHQFAFVGFSINGTSTGQICKVQQIGEVTLQGWNLTPNTQYLAGDTGALQTINNSAGFTKVIGYATTANSLQIIKDYTTINK